ncbi:cytochrome C552 [Flavobacterium sp. WLB]|uniref:c-type cytochrome n=1 Tax=unclassified Flavobacterium TaxID=196869 RepID=UPI0006ABEDAB|nr:MULTISPECIES: c-type cytochrome [unclassified Flavobacterium]KOP37146.1 cytochrome C552 [Flavobacterium sp. VMW]OWU89512.1 cytochrome C552 [Flavobacterium sp. NLM]PUU71744.1 cytochrome C552 [Flavobacterium sp. WLB]
MKKVLFLSAVLAFASCKKEVSESTDQTIEAYSEGESAKAKTPEALGKEIFEGRGNCTSCHQPDQKVIGPSIKEIAKIYKDKKGDIPTFLKGNADPIVDPSQFSVMQTNFGVTKAMSDEELKAIETYIYSHLSN